MYCSTSFDIALQRHLLTRICLKTFVTPYMTEQPLPQSTIAFIHDGMTGMVVWFVVYPISCNVVKQEIYISSTF